MKLLAHAKINWTLDILGQRPDGYHELRMLMQPITLADEITLQPADGLTLFVEGDEDIPADQRNLAWRAADLLLQTCGVQRGVRIAIRKRIPSQAGLGGGSTDAAAVLYGLNRLWDLGLPQEELERIGLSLGADVPFCLQGGLCLAEGVGEKLTRLPNAPQWPMIIVKPCDGLSTAEVYRAWHQEAHREAVQEAALLEAVHKGDASLLPEHPGNALEWVSAAQRPKIPGAIQALQDHGAVCAQMSGSGSAVFGVFKETETRDRALARLKAAWPFTCACGTCEESVTVL